jgi:serine/threonine protein kinase
MTGLLPPSPDFEDERLYASVHSRLFGSGQQVMIGRYVVERRLGAGAMGVVHVARDAELDRRVAIKLVHAQLAAHDVAARMRGEAKALARLAHPNVVHVYEVGEHRGQVFLVMEYVDGSSLRAWIEQDNPAWSARLAAYVEAGRGLAAAHAAGLTHRDFKPDNVLRSADGRVRVADFGLACLDDGGDRLGDVELLETTVESGPMPALLRSRTGEIKGTPVYMPPEQFRGGPIDARADQFAYCVSLYEGLWGSRPFAEDSLRARLRAIQHEGPIAPAQLGGVPRAVWLAVQRGLAADPAARWPSMVELLAALEAVLAPKRRVVLVVAGLAVAAAVGFGLSDATRAEPIAAAPPDPCAQTSGPIDALWTPALREQLQAALPE